MDAKDTAASDLGRLTNKHGGKRLLDENINPCAKEHFMVNQCMRDNDYNNKQCSDYFQNVMNCKKFWAQVRQDRIREQIRPYLPPIEERAQIKEEYMQRGYHFT